MALVLQDRVRESSASTGTGAVTLGGALLGYRTFSSCIPDGSVVYYCIQNTAIGAESEWEVGYGTFTSGTNSLSRDSVYSSSNSNALVPFSSGAELDVFITQPAEQAVFQETNGNLKLINGVIEVSVDGTEGTTLPNATFQAFATLDGYIQNNIQNLSDGADASSDFVATNDQGDDTTFYVDMGINSSGFNSVDFPIYSPNSGYVYSVGNGTSTSTMFVGSGDGDVILHAGGFDTANVVGTASGTDQSMSFEADVNVGGDLDVTGAATFGSTVTLNQDPSANLQAATKQYVDNAVSAGLTIHDPVRVEAASNLNATYNNGTDGVGATLTNAGTQAALEIGGVTLNLNDRVLVYQQTTQTQNGVYYVSNVGSGSTNWVLTRATDADTYGVADPQKLAQGSYFFVEEGSPGSGESYVCNTEGTIIFGTTAITFALFSASPAYIVESPLQLSGNTLSLAGVVDVAHGGTNLSSFTSGDLVYATAATTLAKRAIGTAKNVLVVSGGLPTWGTVDLTSAAAVSGALGATNGGTGQATYTLGDLLYCSATNTLAKLAGNTTTTKKYLQQQGNGAASAAPSWQQIAAADISGLAPSATTDTANATNITSGTLPTGRLTGSYTGVTGVGTLTAGTWTANTVGVSYGGTGVTTLTGLAYGNGTSAFTAASAAQVVAVIGSTAVANATYAVSAGTATNIAGGAAGGIPYQTGSGATTILATGTGVLVGGTTPAYSTTPTLTGTNFSGIPNSATTASASNGASTIVARDINGSFAANVVTATNHVGSGAGLTNLNASNVASGTIPSAILGNSTAYVGTTAVALNRSSANQGLTGISSVSFPGSTSGTAILQATAAAGTPTLSLPTTTGTLALTSQIPTVNNGTLTMAVSGTGLSGSASFTANQAGASTFTVTSNANSANGASTIVARDATGNFAANAVTATTFSGSGASLTNLNASNVASGTIPSAILGNSSVYIGTTAIALNRTTAAQTLSGVGIDGNAGTATTLQTARTINGVSFNGSADIAVGSLYNTAYRRITNPGGAEYVTATATVTGAIAVTLPVGATNTMVRMTIKVYEYATNESFEVHVGGYNYTGGTWVNNSFAYIIGNPSVDRRFNVRLGYDSATAKFIVYIGELASTWSYPQVYVTEVQCGYGGQSVTWTSGWSIGFEASAFKSVTATISNCQVGYAVSTNTANSTVLRDASGNFSAGTITAALSGNATTATTLQTARTLWGQSFNGSGNVTGALSSVTTLGMSGQLTNTVATGTAPFVVSSTTRVANLNVATAGAADTATTATNATNVTVTNDVATATSVYLSWVSATSGNTGTKVSSTKLTMVPSTGTVTSAGNFVANSDERIKTNWRPVQDDFVGKMAQIKSGVYDRTDIELTQAGVSAQSWQALLPETVQADEGGKLSVAYGNAALVAAIELAKEVVKLREELQALKAKTGV